MMDEVSLPHHHHHHQREEAVVTPFNTSHLMDSMQDIIGVPESCSDTLLDPPTKLAELLNLGPQPPRTPPQQVPTQAALLTDHVPQGLPHIFQEAWPLLQELKNTQAFSQVLQDTQAFPQALQNTQAPPQVLQDTQAFPQALHNTQAPPQVLQDTQAFPQVLQDTQAFPQVLQDTQAFPQVLQDTQAFPQVLQDTQAFPQVLQDTQAFRQVLQDTQAFPQVLQEAQVMSQGPQVRQMLQEACPEAQPLSSPETLWEVPALALEEAPQFSPVVSAAKYHCHSPSPPPSQPLPRQAARPRGRRAPKAKQPKLYQQQVFDDPLKEKRRLDAINSKKNRDAKKALMEELRRRVDKATKRRDALWKEVETLRQREEELLSQLNGLPASLPHPLSTHTPTTTLPFNSPVSATTAATPIHPFPHPDLTPSTPTASVAQHIHSGQPPPSPFLKRPPTPSHHH